MTDFQHKLERIMRGDNVISEEEHKAVDKMFNWHIFDGMDQEWYDSVSDKSLNIIRNYVSLYSSSSRHIAHNREEKIRAMLRLLYERDFVWNTKLGGSIDWEESIATGTVVRIGDRDIKAETDPEKIKTHITLCERSHLSDKVRIGLERLREIGYKHTKSKSDNIDWEKSISTGTVVRARHRNIEVETDPEKIKTYIISRESRHLSDKVKIGLSRLREIGYKHTKSKADKIDWEESIATGTVVKIKDRNIEVETDPEKIKDYITLCERRHLFDKVRSGLRRLREVGYEHTKSKEDKINWDKSMDAEILIYEGQTKSLVDDEIAKLEADIRRLRQLRSYV